MLQGRGKKDAKQVAAAAVLEMLLANVPVSDFLQPGKAKILKVQVGQHAALHAIVQQSPKDPKDKLVYTATGARLTALISSLMLQRSRVLRYRGARVVVQPIKGACLCYR